MVDIVFTLVDLFVNAGVPFWIVLRLLIYKIPAIMVLFFPMSVLFAIMLLLVRMAKDNEITVLRSSGISTSRIVTPLVLFAILASLGAYGINEKVVPWANKVSDTLITTSVNKTPPPDISENMFFKDQGDRIFYIRKVHQKEGRMDNLLIFEAHGTFPRVITAQRAQWSQKRWLLTDGFVQQYNDQGLLDFTTRFSQMDIFVNYDLNSFYASEETPRQMNSTQLKSQIDLLKKSGVSTQALKVEYYMKSSMPTACLIFGLIGIAFCLGLVKSGKDWWGVIFSVCAVVLTVGFYFFLMALFRSLGKSGLIPLITPFLGAWIPNMIYGFASLAVIAYLSIYK